MDYLSFYCSCLVFILIWMSGSIKVLLERRVDVLHSLRGALRTTGIKGSDNTVLEFLGCPSRWGLLGPLLVCNFGMFQIFFFMNKIYVADSALL